MPWEDGRPARRHVSVSPPEATSSQFRTLQGRAPEPVERRLGHPRSGLHVCGRCGSRLPRRHSRRVCRVSVPATGRSGERRVDERRGLGGRHDGRVRLDRHQSLPARRYEPRPRRVRPGPGDGQNQPGRACPRTSSRSSARATSSPSAATAAASSSTRRRPTSSPAIRTGERDMFLVVDLESGTTRQVDRDSGGEPVAASAGAHRSSDSTSARSPATLRVATGAPNLVPAGSSIGIFLRDLKTHVTRPNNIVVRVAGQASILTRIGSLTASAASEAATSPASRSSCSGDTPTPVP